LKKELVVVNPWKFTLAHTLVVATIIGATASVIGAIFGSFSDDTVAGAIKCAELGTAIGAMIGFAAGFVKTPQCKKIARKLFGEVK